MKTRILITTVVTAVVFMATASHAAEKKVYESAEETKPLKAGDMVPDVNVRTLEGEEVALRDLAAEQPMALVFYRGGWCPYCTKHLKSLREAEGPLNEMGYQLVAISPDSPENLAEAKEKHRFEYSLYSDADLSAAQAFGIAFRLDKETLTKYDGYGIDLAESSGGANSDALPVPAVFLINTEGEIVWTHSDPDYTKRLDNDDLLSAAEMNTGSKSEGSSKKEGS